MRPRRLDSTRTPSKGRQPDGCIVPHCRCQHGDYWSLAHDWHRPLRSRKRHDGVPVLAPPCIPAVYERPVREYTDSKPTCAIAMYSTTTQDTLTPRTVHIAALVEKPSRKEMTTGARSLQMRSIRLMDAFKPRLIRSAETIVSSSVLPCLEYCKASEMTTAYCKMRMVPIVDRDISYPIPLDRDGIHVRCEFLNAGQ